MAVQLAPLPVFRGFDAFGLPLYLGQLGTFVAGTNTPQVTYKDSLGIATNTNPVILNARGECNLWLDPAKAYKLVLSDALGNQIWMVDNVTIGNANPSFNVIPTVDNLFTLGSPTFSWANVYVGPNHAPVLDTVSGNIGYYARTAAEIAAGVTPTNFSYPPGNVLRYGADPTGAVDASTAFANAFLVKGNIVAVGTFKIGTALMMDGATTSLSGPATINSTVAAGQLITVTSSGTVESVSTNCVRGIKFVGTNIVGVRGIYFNSAVNLIACFNVENCAFTAFDKFVEFFNNAFEITFKGCVFSQGGAAGGCYTNTGGANYGERISFVSCAWFNNTICLKSDYTSCQYFLSNCSLDYSNQLIVMNAGWAFLSNCYVENNLDVAYWFVVGTAGASLFFNNGTIVVTGNKPTFEIGTSAANPGTLVITNSNFYANANNAKPLVIAGSGNARGSGNTIQGFANIGTSWSVFSAASQLCSNGTFVNGAGALGGWTVSNGGAGGLPTVTPANTLAFNVSVNGSTQAAYWQINAEPGQNVGMTCNIKASPAAGAVFQIVLFAFGADGVVIGNSAIITGFNFWDGAGNPLPTAYTAFRTTFPNLPAGTATVRCQLYTGVINTGITISVQNVVISKH